MKRNLLLLAVLCACSSKVTHTGTSDDAGTAGGDGKDAAMDHAGVDAIGGSGGLSCEAGEKLCALPSGSEGCVTPQPLTGCSLADCAPCPGAPNADPICDGNRCSIQCVLGYELLNGICQPIGSGGFGGTGGSGGTSGTGGSGGSATCDPLNCPMCQPAGPFKCCKQDGACGCTWAPGAICY